MNYLEGDILDVNSGIICHQVNCHQTMGSGLALQIKNKYPYVFETYYKAPQLLGTTLVVPVIPGGEVYVANLFGQDLHDSRVRQTNYEALYRALEQLAIWVESCKTRNGMALPIYFPKGMSSSLAGGDWNIVQCMINHFFPDANIMEYK